MCGIFALLNNDQHPEEIIIKNFVKGTDRGPENSILKFIHEFKLTIGFHRLAINGLTDSANQPLFLNECILICNGEIYNYKQLHSLLGIENTTFSDCEIIIHLYKKYGIRQTLRMVDGVFAFLLFDQKLKKIYVARDLFGVRPLFQFSEIRPAQRGLTIGFASEIKMLFGLFKNTAFCSLIPYPPGRYSEYTYGTRGWITKSGPILYTTPDIGINWSVSLSAAQQMIHDNLIAAVKKRIFSTDRKIACLLSGGLDSSLITAIVNRFYKPGKLETYSIGLRGSEDLKYARKVADYLHTEHTEIICTEEEFLKAIPEVIEKIESYDTTTVRASVGNYLVAKYISKHSDAKVIFNGDGSDEVTGGYLYFQCAPDAIEFDNECRRLLKDIHLFDVLRSDRSISSNGLEARTPFLDKYFVQSYLSLPPNLRFHRDKCEKYLLRSAFESSNLLPKEVLFRTKEAFSDGVSPQNKSWFEIIQNYVETLSYTASNFTHNPPTTKEQQYYRYLFEENYKDAATLIPYFWMPRFIEATDSSARTLNIYKNKGNIHNNGEKKHNFTM